VFLGIQKKKAPRNCEKITTSSSREKGTSPPEREKKGEHEAGEEWGLPDHAKGKNGRAEEEKKTPGPQQKKKKKGRKPKGEEGKSWGGGEAEPGAGRKRKKRWPMLQLHRKKKKGEWGET